jgi:hypothetical protein
MRDTLYVWYLSQLAQTGKMQYNKKKLVFFYYFRRFNSMIDGTALNVIIKVQSF